MVASLKGTPRDTGLDLDLLEEINDYFTEVRKKYAEFESDFKTVDISILKSQIPGGMISNMENQLREQNSLDKLDEVLKEVPRVRKDMGYPPLVTPTSQIVGSQATLNVLTGERYKVITKETRQCLLGNYGKLPAPIDEELLAKVSGDKEITSCRPADLLEPEWDKACKELGDKYNSEEDRLTYALFAKVALKFFETRGKPQPEAVAKAPATAPAPSAASSVPTGTAIYRVRVNGKDYSVEVSTGGAVGASPSIATVPATASVTAPAPSTASGSPLIAPLPGSIFTMICKEGDVVNEGDTVLIMESMKMESEVNAHRSGTIQSILVKEGDNVQTGDELVIIG